MSSGDTQRSLTAFVDETDLDSDDTAEEAAAIESRLEELEAGIKSVATSVENTLECVEQLADRVDRLDGETDVDAPAEDEQNDRTTPGFH